MRVNALGAQRDEGRLDARDVTERVGHVELARVAVLRAAGEAFGAIVEREIFSPFGMTSTHWFDARSLPSPRRALSHAVSGTEYRVSFPDSEVVGGNNLYTSVEDFLKWEANPHTAAVGGRSLIDQLLAQATLPSGEPIPYANGLRRCECRGLRTILRGASGGYASEMVRFPDQGLLVVTMCNVVPAAAYKLDIAVAEVFLGAQVAPAAALADDSVSTPADELARYAGTYRPVDLPWSLVRIEARDGALHELLPEGASRLSRGRDGTFVADGIAYAFSPPPGDQAATLTLPGVEPPAWTELLHHVPEGTAWRPDAPAIGAYEGAYFSADLATTWRIEAREGVAVVARVGLADAPLTPVLPDFVTCEIAALESRLSVGVRFVRDSDGRVTAFTVSTPPQADHVRDLSFDRRHDAA